MRTWTIRSATVLGFVGCTMLTGCSRTASTDFDTTVGQESYALFELDHDSGETDNVLFHVTKAEPGTSYVLLYSRDAPQNAGWFQLDPENCDSMADCPGADGYGTIVDVETVRYDGSVVLTGQDSDSGYIDSVGHDRDSWSCHWAVMRVQRRGSSELSLHVDSTAGSGDYGTAPDIHRIL